MKKGQILLEALGTVSIVTAIFYLSTYLAADMRVQDSALVESYQKDILCRQLASAIDTIYAAGDGTWADYPVSAQMTVAPGRIILEEDNKSSQICVIEKNALTNITKLRSGLVRLQNRGGEVVFT